LIKIQRRTRVFSKAFWAAIQRYKGTSDYGELSNFKFKVESFLRLVKFTNAQAKAFTGSYLGGTAAMWFLQNLDIMKGTVEEFLKKLSNRFVQPDHRRWQ
jgi:hypothetical protein